MPIVEEINSNPVSDRSGQVEQGVGLDSNENSQDEDDFFKKSIKTKKNKNFLSPNL